MNIKINDLISMILCIKNYIHRNDALSCIPSKKKKEDCVIPKCKYGLVAPPPCDICKVCGKVSLALFFIYR